MVSTRAKYAMERYQIGIENVQFMVSKWADAYMQLRAFVATEQATCSKEKAVRINQSRRALACYLLIALLQLRRNDRARSRLCRSQILQVNMRLKALAEIYTMHSFTPSLESIIENWGKKNLAKTTPKR